MKVEVTEIKSFKCGISLYPNRVYNAEFNKDTKSFMVAHPMSPNLICPVNKKFIKVIEK